jgi:hypothetical protein
VKSPATLTVGTAREHAERGEGFSANGESQWTRNAAQPGNVKMRGFHENEPGTSPYRPGPRTTAENIRFNEIEIARMQNAARKETNPAGLAKLAKNIAIKSAFVEKLKREM